MASFAANPRQTEVCAATVPDGPRDALTLFVSTFGGYASYKFGGRHMNSYVKRLSLVAAALTVAAVLFLPAMLHGDEFNLKTYITVSQPFQVPGEVLQPNVKYVLRRLDAIAGTDHL